MTLSIEIKNDVAYNILESLEKLDAIKIVQPGELPPPQKKWTGKQKMSERFGGCISKERAAELRREIAQMREEWD